MQDLARPLFRDFMPDGATVQTINEVFVNSPDLYRYTAALDRHIDGLEIELNKQELIVSTLITAASKKK